MDHAGAFGHAGHTIGNSGGGWKSECLGDQFGECIGCADCAGCGEPGVVRVGEVGVGGWNLVEDFGNGESLQPLALKQATQEKIDDRHTVVQ